MENHMNTSLGIDRLGVFGMPPVQLVELAADLGCDSVGIGLAPTPGYNPDNHPAWSLRDDPALRRETIAAQQRCGVRIAMVEGFVVMPGRDIRSCAQDLDLVRELGGDRVVCVSVDRDMQRTIDGFATLSEMAAERGLPVSAEMGSLGPYGRVESALTMVRAVGMGNFSLLIDSMHFFRLGNTIEQFAAIDPKLIGYVQLCDAPWAPRFETYMEEAMYERMAPGDGELPLREFVALLPPDVVVSLETPMRSLADRGVGPRERMAPCVAAARAMLADRGR
jgi:sugar phosphate isomerase/epimerase